MFIHKFDITGLYINNLQLYSYTKQKTKEQTTYELIMLNSVYSLRSCDITTFKRTKSVVAED